MQEIVGTEQFANEVTASQQLTLVDFWGPNCGPCRAMMPILERLARQTPDVKFVKVDCTSEADNRELSAAHKIYGIPCLIFFKEGKEVKRLLGLQTEDTIKLEIQKFK